MEKETTAFTLAGLDVSEYTEKKNGFTYLSWAYAWQKLKEAFPKANARVRHNANGLNYFTDGRTAWVEVEVTADGETWTEESLPVMDFRNQSIALDKLDSMAVNKAIKRCTAKAIALLTGCGLYLYQGEDIPQAEGETTRMAAPKTTPPASRPAPVLCEHCGNIISSAEGFSVEKIIERSMKAYGKKFCFDCCIHFKEALNKGEEAK